VKRRSQVVRRLMRRRALLENRKRARRGGVTPAVSIVEQRQRARRSDGGVDAVLAAMMAVAVPRWRARMSGGAS
jgi:hypothetical protein